jgi:hypothetical protein
MPLFLIFQIFFKNILYPIYFLIYIIFNIKKNELRHISRYIFCKLIYYFRYFHIWNYLITIYIIITSSKDENLKKEYPTHYIVVKSGSKKLLEGDLVKLSSEVKKGVKVKMTEIIRGGKPLESMKEYETGTLERIVVGDKEVEEYKVEEGNQD